MTNVSEEELVIGNCKVVICRRASPEQAESQGCRFRGGRKPSIVRFLHNNCDAIFPRIFEGSTPPPCLCCLHLTRVRKPVRTSVVQHTDVPESIQCAIVGEDSICGDKIFNQRGLQRTNRGCRLLGQHRSAATGKCACNRKRGCLYEISNLKSLCVAV